MENYCRNLENYPLIVSLEFPIKAAYIPSELTSSENLQDCGYHLLDGLCCLRDSVNSKICKVSKKKNKNKTNQPEEESYKSRARKDVGLEKVGKGA